MTRAGSFLLYNLSGKWQKIHPTFDKKGKNRLKLSNPPFEKGAN